MSGYRSRIYQNYVHGRQEALAPSDLNGFKPRAALLRKLIREHFPANREANIVDLGCGHGALVYFARTMGYRNVLGLDTSPAQVAEAKRLAIEGVRQADLMDGLSALPDASQDLVVAFDVIEHFTKDELLKFVDQVRRVLKPGGRWLLHTPNGESPFGSRMRYWDFTHEQAFTRESISQLLLTSGFSRVACYEDQPVAHGAKSAVRLVLWKMLRTGLRLWVAIETGSGKGCIFSQNFLVAAEK